MSLREGWETPNTRRVLLKETWQAPDHRRVLLKECWKAPTPRGVLLKEAPSARRVLFREASGLFRNHFGPKAARRSDAPKDQFEDNFEALPAQGYPDAPND